MTEQIQFTIKFDGEAVQNHEMDVADFARSLMGLSDLFEATNKKLNSNDARTNLKIQATREGSFEVILSLTQHLQAQLSAIGIVDVAMLAGLVFGGRGVIDLLRWLKGEKIKSIEKSSAESSHDFIITNRDGAKLEINKDAKELLEDPIIRKAVQDTMSPLERDGVETLNINSKKSEPIKITKSEVKYFAAPDKSGKDDEILKEFGKGWFTILSPDFEDGHKWKVFDGNSKFYVLFEDEKFIDDVQNKQVSFCKDDMILCEHIKHQFHDSNGKLKTEYTVTQVLELRSGAKQLDLT